jgi:hypothetical protein
VEVSANTTTEYGEDLKPRRIRAEQNEFGRPKVIEATLSDGQLHVTSRAGELETRKTLTPGPRFGSEVVLAFALQRGLLEAGQTYTFQTFVPELEMLVDFEVTPGEREALQVEGQEVPAVRLDFRARDIGLEMRWWMDDTGNLVRQVMPSLMNLVIEKVSEEEALTVVAPFALADHIPVSEKMGPARGLTRVTLKAGSPGLPASELVPETPLQQVTPLGLQEAKVVVQGETEEGLRGRSLPFAGEDLAEFLQPTDILQSDDPAIAAKAKEIVGDEKDAWEAAKKLIRWVHENMGKVDHDPRPITASECLKLMRGDCSEHATLLAALARAVGLPSKFATGVVYLNDGYYYHAWNELYVGRWVSCDPTWGEVTSNAGHLTLASGSLTAQSFARTNLQAVRCMGVLTLQVLDHGRD